MRAGGASTTAAAGAGGAAGDARASGAAGGSACSAGGVGGITGFAVLISRGGGREGAAGFGGSALPPDGFFPFAGAGVSANDAFEGTLSPRLRAIFETNSRATTSSIVLDALVTSMPWSRLRSAMTSWLVVLRSSATL
jgi:hypothetical protein